MTRLLPVATPGAARRDIARRLARHRLAAAGAAGTLVLATAAGLVVPPVLGMVVDAVLTGDGGVDALAALLLAVVGVSALFTGVATWLVDRLGESVLADLREDVVDRALTIDQERLEAAGAGDLLARIGPDVDAVSDAFREAVPVFLMACLAVALTGVGLLVLNPWFLLAAAVALPIHVVTVRRYLRRSTPLFAAERVAVSARMQRMLDVLSGARSIRARGDGPVARDRLEAASGEEVTRSVRAARAGADFGAALNAAEFVALAGVLVAGFLLVREGQVTVGAATAAALYIHRLFDPVMTLLTLIDTIQDATASLVRLVGVAAIVPPPSGDGRSPDGLELVLHDVHATYGDRPPVLHGVSLRLAPGEQVALVGASGAGKTTIGRIAGAMHRVSAGTVTLGGRTPDELGPTGWRDHVVVVTQESHVFAGTLADDLRLARPEATDVDILQALDRVGAAAWVDALPDGPLTVVGEGGHRLTPLQAQQVALARVVLADPGVVVLDEATAEAGSAAAEELSRSARACIAGRSSMVIAHRLDEAARADRILVVDAGRITEQGTHQELLAHGAGYAALWRAWSANRVNTTGDDAR